LKTIPADFPSGIIFLLKLNREWEKIPIFRVANANRGKKIVACFIADNDRTCREECETTRFEGDIFASDAVCFGHDGAFERELIFESDNHKNKIRDNFLAKCQNSQYILTVPNQSFEPKNSFGSGEKHASVGIIEKKSKKAKVVVLFFRENIS
jgi:hypothetical protein